MALVKGVDVGGYIEIPRSIRFMNPVQFMQGSGFLPRRSRVYFVDGLNGSDSYDGTAASKPFATIGKARTVMNARIDWAATPWANGDFMIIAPGEYAENLTSLPYGCTMIGVGHDVRDGQNGVKIKPETGHPFTGSSVINSAFYNICFESPGADEAFDANVVNNCHFENCMFTGAAETTTCTEAFEVSDCVKTTFKSCWFCNAAYGMRFEYADAGDSISYVLIDDCVITGVGTCGIYTSANLVGPHSLITRTHIGGGGQTLTHGVSDTSHIFEMDWSCIEASTAVGSALRGVNGSYGNGTLLT